MDQKRHRTATTNAHEGESSEEEQMNTPARASNRRFQTRVDLNMMEAASLKRYRQVYKLEEAEPGSTKEELMPAVARHFAAQVVDEVETLRSFAATLRQRAGVSGTFFAAPAAVKKPRAAPKR